MPTLFTLAATVFKINENIKGRSHGTPEGLIFPAKETYSDLEDDAHYFKLKHPHFHQNRTAVVGERAGGPEFGADWAIAKEFKAGPSVPNQGGMLMRTGKCAGGGACSKGGAHLKG